MALVLGKLTGGGLVQRGVDGHATPGMGAQVDGGDVIRVAPVALREVAIGPAGPLRGDQA